MEGQGCSLLLWWVYMPRASWGYRVVYWCPSTGWCRYSALQGGIGVTGHALSAAIMGHPYYSVLQSTAP